MENSNGNTIKSAVAPDREWLRNLDRVTLVDVKNEWTKYQSTRARYAIYWYLHQVFMQVDWWNRNPEEKKIAVQAIIAENPNIKLPDDDYAVVIMCTADPKKMDSKMRSKLSRVLQYAAKFKHEKELLQDFLRRKGGVNKCAARYTSRLRRNTGANAVGRKKTPLGRALEAYANSVRRVTAHDPTPQLIPVLRNHPFGF